MNILSTIKHRLPSKSSGFSLLEVIASAAVLGMAISFSYSSQTYLNQLSHLLSCVILLLKL